MFKKGDAVKQVLPAPVVGTVEGFGLCQETGEVTMRVVSVDADGAAHERYFKQDELVAADAQ
jgi:hypothetical protein